MFRTFGIVGLLFVLSLTFCDGLREGDACQVLRSGAAGTCKLLRNCQEALDTILQTGQFPAHCDWNMNREEVICCQNPVTKKPKPTQSNRLSARKCKEYEDAVYEKMYVSVGFNSKPIEQKILRCFSSQVPLVVGGVIANEKEFPHMALIGYRSNFGDLTYGCGGSLISELFILTAAHCILTSRLVGPPRVIRLGEHDRSTDIDNDAVVDIDVAQSIPHPSYKKIEKYNDIGLIQMVHSVQFNQYIRPACLPEAFTTGTAKAIATGWGKTDYKAQGSDILMKVVLELYSDDECRELFAAESHSSQLKNGIIARTQFCAGSRFERKDVCQGDSGGPLQVDHPYNTCLYTIAGVTSFGKRCSASADNGTSGIYTRVYSYVDWIEGIVWP